VANTIVVGDGTGNAVKLILPMQGLWNCTFPSGTNAVPCIQQYGNTRIQVEGTAGSPSFYLNMTACTIGTNCPSYMWTDPISSNGYIYQDGIKFENYGSATTTGIGWLATGLVDFATFRNINVTDEYDTYAGEFLNVCCQVTGENVEFSGNSGSGVTPLFIDAPGGGSSISLLTFRGLIANAPGAGEPNIQMTDGLSQASQVEIYGIYEEGNSSDCTTTMNQMSGMGTVGFFGGAIKSKCSSSTAAAFSRDNSGNGMFTADNIYLGGTGGGSFTYPAISLIDNNGRSCPSAPCDSYSDPKGNINHLYTSYVTTLAGTSAGSAIWDMPRQNPGEKVLYLWLAGYENTTATAQTITIPTPYTGIVGLITVSGSCTGVTTTKTTITLPSSMGATQNGLCKVEGF
jgi:hypothetical protein